MHRRRHATLPPEPVWKPFGKPLEEKVPRLSDAGPVVTWRRGQRPQGQRVQPHALHKRFEPRAGPNRHVPQRFRRSNQEPRHLGPAIPPRNFPQQRGTRFQNLHGQIVNQRRTNAPQARTFVPQRQVIVPRPQVPIRPPVQHNARFTKLPPPRRQTVVAPRLPNIAEHRPVPARVVAASKPAGVVDRRPPVKFVGGKTWVKEPHADAGRKMELEVHSDDPRLNQHPLQLSCKVS